MSLILAYQNRGLTKDITITDGAGETVAVGASDTLRVIIGHPQKLGSALVDAKLVVTSAAPTANGSSFTRAGGTGGSHRLRLDASDLVFEPGTYTMFVDLLDNADAAEWKNVDRQVFRLEGT